MGFLPLPLLGVLTRALLIANPASRRGGQFVEAARQAILAGGATCDVMLTERAGHAGEIGAAVGRRYDIVFTLGGDVRAIDLGVVLGHRFAVAAGVGIDAAMVAETPAWMKKRLGVLAYTIIATRAALRAVMLRRFFLVRVEVDGEVVERRAAAVLFANFGAILEDRIAFGPDIVVDDGMLDCCIFSPSNLRDAMRIMWRVTRRDFRPDSALLYRKGTRFRLETIPILPLQADGELLGVTPAEITVEPLAAHLLVPAR